MLSITLRGLGIVTGLLLLAQGFVSAYELNGLDLVATAGALACTASWIASIFVWTRVRSRSVLHYIALAILIVVGFVVGWVYLLFRAEEVGAAHRDERSAYS